MMHDVTQRLQQLEQRADELRQLAKTQVNTDANDVLWMSSLDIIGELLSVVQQLLQKETVSYDTSAYHTAGQEWRQSYDGHHLACPRCHSLIEVSYEEIAEAATACPVCGDNILLSNPT